MTSLYNTTALADESILTQVDVAVANSQITLQLPSSDIVRVVINGPDGLHGESSSATVFFNAPLKDGQYHYQIDSSYTSNEVVVDDGTNGRAPHTQSSPERSKVIAGQFSISNGVLVSADDIE